MKQYIALLISGEIRTFVLREQILFFKNLMTKLQSYYTYVHVYITLKIPDTNSDYTYFRGTNKFIQSEQGLTNFKELITILNPISLRCFYDFKYANYHIPYFNGQLKMIDMCINDALIYQQHNSIVYDTFFRIRPDCYIKESDLNIDQFQDNYIYTGIKVDTIANDNIFIFDNELLNTWWLAHIRPNIQINAKQIGHISPEYYIYNCVRDKLKSQIANWLIRDYNSTQTWSFLDLPIGSFSQILLNEEYHWTYKEEYDKICILLEHNTFMEKLREFVPIIEEYLEI
jgi:hypothetical protein